MPDAPNNREGHQAREPSKCLNGWSYEETVDCGETDREEIVVGNACGRKLGSHGSKEILLSYV